MAKKYYAVRKGFKPGIYREWFGTGGAHEQVDGFSGAVYKGFKTLEEAESFMKGEYAATQVNGDAHHTPSESCEQEPSTGRDYTHVSAIGSDETGKGEIFRSILVTAAFVEADMIEVLRDMGVRDSKAYSGNAMALERLGYELTGISSRDEIDFKALKDGLYTETEYVKAVSVLLPNEVYEKVKSPQYNLDSILVDAHLKAITPLQDRTSGEYEAIIVDDFMAGMRTGKRASKYVKFEDGLRAAGGDFDILFEMKADAKYMSVSAASIISTYLERLYLEHLQEVLFLDYGIESEVPDGPVSKRVREFITMLEDNGAFTFFSKYGKVSYIK